MLCYSVAKHLPEHPVFGWSYCYRCHKAGHGHQKCLVSRWSSRVSLKAIPVLSLTSTNPKKCSAIDTGGLQFTILRTMESMTNVKGAVYDNRKILCFVYSSRYLFGYFVSDLCYCLIFNNCTQIFQLCFFFCVLWCVYSKLDNTVPRVPLQAPIKPWLHSDRWQILPIAFLMTPFQCSTSIFYKFSCLWSIVDLKSWLHAHAAMIGRS